MSTSIGPGNKPTWLNNPQERRGARSALRSLTFCPAKARATSPKSHTEALTPPVTQSMTVFGGGTFRGADYDEDGLTGRGGQLERAGVSLDPRGRTTDYTEEITTGARTHKKVATCQPGREPGGLPAQNCEK